MLPAVIALFFSPTPEQTSSASGLPTTFNPYPSLAPTSFSNAAVRVTSSLSSYSTPSYSEWRNAIIHAAGPSATFHAKTDRDCRYDVEYGDLAKRATNPRDLAAMLRDEYLPAPTPTAASGIIDGRGLDPYEGYPPLTPSVYTTTSKGKGTTATLRTTYLVPIPTHEVWTWKEKARRTPAVQDRGLVSTLSHMGSSVSSALSTIIDERAPVRTLTIDDNSRRAASVSHMPPLLQPLVTNMPLTTLSNGNTVYGPVTYRAASTSGKKSTKTSVSQPNTSRAWTTVTARPDTLSTHATTSNHPQPKHESQTSRPVRSSFTTSFSIAPHQLMTIVYEEEVVTIQTTGGGVTRTLTETLIHYPALPPVPPITWTVPRPTTTRSTTSTSRLTAVTLLSTNANDIDQASIAVITSKTTKPATTTTVTRASAVTTVSPSILNSPANKNRPLFSFTIAGWRGFLTYILVLLGMWLIPDVTRSALAVVLTVLAFVVQHAVFKPAVTQIKAT